MSTLAAEHQGVRFLSTNLDGVLIVEPKVHRDHRGFFLESFHGEKYRLGGIDAVFVQDNHSSSTRGTLRGLHAQRHKPQGKLVRVVVGEIYDVAVDIRRGAEGFGAWVGVRLSAENFRQLYVPPGFAHGFCVVTETAQVEYKCTELYDPDDEFTIVWNDPQLAIDWPIAEPRLSERDRWAPRLSEVEELLPRHSGRKGS